MKLTSESGDSGNICNGQSIPKVRPSTFCWRQNGMPQRPCASFAKPIASMANLRWWPSIKVAPIQRYWPQSMPTNQKKKSSPSGKVSIWITWLSRSTEISNDEYVWCWDLSHSVGHRRCGHACANAIEPAEPSSAQPMTGLDHRSIITGRLYPAFKHVVWNKQRQGVLNMTKFFSSA